MDSNIKYEFTSEQYEIVCNALLESKARLVLPAIDAMRQAKKVVVEKPKPEVKDPKALDKNARGK
jgi:hypothetical protein